MFEPVVIQRMGAASIDRRVRSIARRGRVMLVAAALLGVAYGSAEGMAQGTFLEFQSEALTLLSAVPDQPRLDVHVSVAYPSLRFVRRAEGFYGAYNVRADLYRAGRGDRPSGRVGSRSWERALEGVSYERTQSASEADRSSDRFDVPPGRYVLQLRVEDVVTGRVATEEHVVEVPSLGGAVAVSDLVIADAFDRQQARVAPIVGGTVSSDDPTFTLYFELGARQAERLRVRYVVYALGPDRRRGLVGGLFGRRERERTTVMQFADWESVTPGRSVVTRVFPLNRFEIGEYELGVRVERADGTVLAERERPLVVRWTGLLEQLQDLDVAIAQLRYVAKPSEIRAMREAPTLAERHRLFREFWDRRDPSPGSPRNERMEEYYYRVAFANRHYGRLDGTGWDTDQGEVFVRFGEPDRIETRPGAAGQRPHQVWYYERMGRRFIFVDEGGRGNYRLLVPIWDERTRM